MVHFPVIFTALVGFTTLARGVALSGSSTYEYGGTAGEVNYGVGDNTAPPPDSGSAGSDPSTSVQSTSAASTADMATGDVQCSRGMCIGAIVKDNTVQYAVQSDGTSQVGWMAMGFGTAMVGSPMVVMWKNPDGTITMSQRKASSRSLPAVDPAPPRVAVLNQDLSVTSGTQPKFVYTVPIDEDMKPSLIWAYGKDTPSSADGATATFRQHASFGFMTLDLTKSTSAAILETPALSLTAPATSGSGNGTSGGKKDDAPPKSSAEKVILAHAIVCTFAFLVVMPAGALLARLFRTFTSGWFQGHWILQFGISAPLVLTGAILAGCIARAGGPEISNTHTQVGVLLFVLYGLQCLLGGVIHYVKPKNFNGRPPQNYLHAILGISIIGVSFYQVHTGYTNEWPNAVGRDAPAAINVLWYIWIVAIPLLYFGGLALLKRQFNQEKASRAQTLKQPSWEDLKGYP